MSLNSRSKPKRGLRKKPVGGVLRWTLCWSGSLMNVRPEFTPPRAEKLLNCRFGVLA